MTEREIQKVRCSSCGARPGFRCVDKRSVWFGGKMISAPWISGYHKERITRARKELQRGGGRRK